MSFYSELIEYFFQNDKLHFRAVIVPDKSLLRHEDFKQDHDTWYYKMYFQLLKVILRPGEKYRIYLDIKDTRGGITVRGLHDVLCTSLYDFDRTIVERMQVVRSNLVVLVQLTDLLIGVVSYANRNLAENSGKVELVRKARELSGYQLNLSTLVTESKFNIFRWRAREIE